MKKIISLFLASVLTMVVSVCAYADGSPQFDCKNFSGFYDENEFAEVMRDLRGDNTAVNGTAAINAGNAEGGDKASAYKVYTSNASWFFEKLSEGASVSELVDDDYYWLIPWGNSVAFVDKNEDDKWEAVGSAAAPSDADDAAKSNVVKFDEVNAAIKSLDQNVSSKVKDIRCVNLPEYHSYFVFVTLNDAIYAVSYSTVPDFTGLENGVLYSSDEALLILKQNMGEVYAEDVPTADPLEIPAGGAGYKTLNTADEITASAISRSEGSLLLLALISAAVIASGITAAVLIWNRKSKHKQ